MSRKVIPGSLIKTVVNDAVANDSDKSFSPSGEFWRIQAIFVVFTSTASPGNRQLVVRIKDGSDVIYQSPAGAVQADTLTVNYNWAMNNARESAAVAGALDVPLPNLVLSPDYTVQVLDSAAIDAAADDMTVRILAETF